MTGSSPTGLYDMVHNSFAIRTAKCKSDKIKIRYFFITCYILIKIFCISGCVHICFLISIKSTIAYYCSFHTYANTEVASYPLELVFSLPPIKNIEGIPNDYHWLMAAKMLIYILIHFYWWHSKSRSQLHGTDKKMENGNFGKRGPLMPKLVHPMILLLYYKVLNLNKKASVKNITYNHK